MTDGLDLFRYISYVRLRWRLAAASCAIAVALAAGVSLALPRLYTATARILIEPPAGADPRSALAVSPIYLESLKTYEDFASSDSLFQKAADRFQLRAAGGPPIESLKKSVLKAGLVHNTRLLEISVTLRDAAKAHAVAQYLAEEAVAANHALIEQSGRDVIAGIGQQERDARARLDRADADWSRLAASDPVDDLQNDIYQAGQLRAGIEQKIDEARVSLAGGADSGRARAQLEELRKQLDTLNRETADKERLLAGRLARRERQEAERKASRDALSEIETRLRAARNDLGYRGERLSILDSGVVPERPSSPNVALNLAAALLLGLLLPVVYLAIAMSFQQQRAESRRGALQKLAKTGDE